MLRSPPLRLKNFKSFGHRHIRTTTLVVRGAINKLNEKTEYVYEYYATVVIRLHTRINTEIIELRTFEQRSRDVHCIYTNTASRDVRVGFALVCNNQSVTALKNGNIVSVQWRRSRGVRRSQLTPKCERWGQGYISDPPPNNLMLMLLSSVGEYYIFAYPKRT